jgi:hypothetical protein
MRIVKYILLCVFCSVTIVDCTHSADNQPGYSDALIVYPGANNVRFHRGQGSDQVAYEIVENYPAKRIIGWVSDQLKQMHWQPVEYDVLNPGVKSSHIVGWQRFIDGTTEGVDYEVYHWLADWKNTSGSVVRYEFRYRYPKDSKPELTKLEVFATFIPASSLKQVQ